MMNTAMEKLVNFDLSKNVLMKINCCASMDKLLSNMKMTGCRRRIDKIAKVDNSRQYYEIFIQDSHGFNTFMSKVQKKPNTHYIFDAFRIELQGLKPEELKNFSEDLVDCIDENSGYDIGLNGDVTLDYFNRLTFEFGNDDIVYVASKMADILEMVNQIKKCVEKTIQNYTDGYLMIKLTFLMHSAELCE